MSVAPQTLLCKVLMGKTNNNTTNCVFAQIGTINYTYHRNKTTSFEVAQISTQKLTMTKELKHIPEKKNTMFTTNVTPSRNFCMN